VYERTIAGSLLAIAGGLILVAGGLLAIAGGAIALRARRGDTNGTDEFIARQAWLYVSIVTAGYLVSRGLAKSGSRDPYTGDSHDHDH